MRKPSLSKMACIVFVLCVAAAIAAPAQTYTVLYNFSTSGGPNSPYENVIAQGRDGNMYSTTNQGWGGGVGDVFSITPAGTLKVLHNFSGPDGESPVGGVTLGTDGNYYGTAVGGGKFGHGTIFKITATGTLTTLYSFTNGADGSAPTAVPIEGSDGNFYGTASSSKNTYGSVYKITPAGVFTRLHTFNGSDGAAPLAPLVQGTDGNFYGTTRNGGTFGYGTVFRIGPLGKFAVLYNFDGTHGVHPYAPLNEGTDGFLYGVTSYTPGGGTVFKITSGGELTILHNFTGGSDGENPIGGMVRATDGNFYGTDDIGPLDFVGGVIFRISPKGTFDTLYDFNYTDGGSAQTTLLQHTNGLLYGETCCGGSAGNGVFYSLDVGLSPFVSFVRSSGIVGDTAQILGQGFTGTTAVSFNGIPAAFTVVSDTYLTATVPAGATTGFVTVTEPSGTLKSNPIFRVTPQVLSLSPTSGPVGTSVVLTGESLTGTKVVSFNGTEASFTVDSDTQITAIVPAGATSGEVWAHTAGGCSDTTHPIFTVTP
jgi:uncharacterized repeat protein (TIGR03803 family)